MKKIEGMTGTHDRHGNVVLEYNSQSGYTGSDTKKILPCNTCSAVYEIEGNVVSFQCDECVEHTKTCQDDECLDHAHPVRGNGAPPYDAATATGMYDQG